MESSIIKIRDFSYVYPGTDNTVLNNLCMDIGPGECHCITGPTGSGKSTFLLAVKGLLSNGRSNGKIIPSQSNSSGTSRIGIVLQNPETQVLGATIGTEMAFGLENLGVLPGGMEAKIKTQLSAVGLNKPLDHPVSNLSTGEKYRLILAAVLVMEPALILIDEPGAQLDSHGISQLNHILNKMKQSGKSVLICEHRPGHFSEIIDHYWKLDSNGHLNSFNAIKMENASLALLEKTAKPSVGENYIVEIDHLTPKTNGHPPVWSDLTLSVHCGSKTAVYGPNGAGKTTLLRCLTGFVLPEKGTVRIFGNPPSPECLRGKIGCLFQNPQKQLFENTVFEEVAFPLKRMGLTRNEVNAKVTRLLEMMELDHLGDLSPHKLSFGQKHLVVLASILVFDPCLLLLDDPFAGLDDQWKKKVTHILLQVCKNPGTTLIWSGHQIDDLFPEADRMVTINRGRIEISN